MLSNQLAMFTLTSYAYVEKVCYEGDFQLEILDITLELPRSN